MKKLIYLIVFILVCCNDNIPISKIEFGKIEKNTKRNHSYYLYFSSDKELVKSLNKYAYSELKCFFLNKKITEKDYDTYEGYSLTSADELELIKKDSLYYYKTRLSFTHTNFEKRRDPKKEIIGVRKIMQKNNGCLSCTVTAVAMLSLKKRYISGTMCLPETELKKVLEKHFNQINKDKNN